MGQNPTRTVKENLLVSSSAQQLCWCPGSRAVPSTLGTQWGSAASLGAAGLLWHPSSLHQILLIQRDAESPQPPACVPAGHTPGSQHQICDTKNAWEGLEGPSARLGEDPRSEMLKGSQDGSIKTTSRSVCPALKVLFVLQLWLEESSSQTAAGNGDGETQWMIGSVGISQAWVTAPSTTQLCSGGLPPQTLWGISNSRQVLGSESWDKTCFSSSSRTQGLPCPAQGSRGRTGSVLPAQAVLGQLWKSKTFVFTCKMPRGAKCPAEGCCHPWDKGLSPGSSLRSPCLARGE